jgi:hypothetical protein
MRLRLLILKLQLVAAAFFLASALTPVSAQDTGFGDDGFGDGFGDEQKSGHTFKGFVELDNTISTFPDQDMKDIFKKDEIRVNLNYRYGKDTFYFQSEMNLYLSPNIIDDSLNPGFKYSEKFDVKRNLTVTSELAEVNFRELYVNYETGRWRFRAGNQVYAWGTADVFNPTSYFNPYDLREFLFKDDENELRMGIPSLSMLVTFGNDSIEVVTVPVHTPSMMPAHGTFWTPEYSEGPFPVVISDPAALPFNAANMGVGIKYYRNIEGIDLHASLYHGPDREPAMQPQRTIYETGGPVSILVIPEFAVHNAAGLALSKTQDKFIFQAEVVYSPDRTGVVEVDTADVTPDTVSDLLPFKTRKSHYISYSAGFNYMVPAKEWFKSHEGECVFTTEWYQSKYFDDELMKPQLTDIFTARLQDTFINGKLTASLTGIVETEGWGFIMMPKTSYKFDTGLSAEIYYAYISAGSGSTLSYYGDNDIFAWRVRYDF